MREGRKLASLAASREALGSWLAEQLPPERADVLPATSETKPKDLADLSLIVTEFATASPLTCSENDWEVAIAGPLRFVFRSVQSALHSVRRETGRIVVFGMQRAARDGGLAEAAAAALACFVRSLSLEALPLGIRVYGVIVTSGAASPGPLLAELLFEQPTSPSGTTLDVRPRGIPATTPSFPRRPRPSEKQRQSEPRVAVATGAAQGLGQAIAKHLAAHGSKILLFDKEGKLLREAVNELTRDGFCVEGCEGDVANRADVGRAAEKAISRWGRLDIWVNNAGISIQGAIAKLSVADWDRMLDVNLKGTLWGSQVAFTAMGENGGTILNVSSTAARTGGLVYPGRYNAYAPYAASKAGVNALTLILAREGAQLGIRVNAIAPGPILTDLARRVYSPQQRGELEEHIPLGRWGEPAEVAAAAGFLVSDDAAFITGHVLTMDGGLSLLSPFRSSVG